MLKTFILPSIVLILGTAAFFLHLPWLYIVGTAIGITKILLDSYEHIKEGDYSLDYIAFLAMVVGLVSGEYLAAIVVALMFTGGDALETFAGRSAERSLKALLSRIPKNALVQNSDGSETEVPLREVKNGDIIIVRGGELIPLDGDLISDSATLNEANLTGESLPVTAEAGDFIKSGVVNDGELLKLKVSGTFNTSTYARIVDLVAEAEKHQAPFVRLAAKANFPFTAITLILAGIAFAMTGELARSLAVLVIATPCPLIIAAPVAFIGGLSRGARENIIIKRPVALEVVSRAKTIFFDKTGTLTLGEPALTEIRVASGHTESETEILSFAAALESHSIHPLARAIVAEAKRKSVIVLSAKDVKETLGKGISGEVDKDNFAIHKAPEKEHTAGSITLELTKNNIPLAYLAFSDVIKSDAFDVLDSLTEQGFNIGIITGDTKENADKLFANKNIVVYSNATPEDKYRIIDETKERGETVMMIGDGLNDAPALAHADVGVVFSGTENSAAVETAQIVILGHDVKSVAETINIAKRSMKIASESVWSGIILSTGGMLFALFGFIVPVTGALIQEAIDVIVILNAVRAAFGGKSDN